ncbi:PilZ domain-containing protein [Candidatus Nitrotoga sp. HW29]|uniref:flagellar brake protein n=1 Tax=Candidatus Nitrotoga sp. HW29 TaxID=2886963 RepID=UPI001EF3699B|nr:flagellar brake protein [Candidatus Nitrotoga sp. HW29]CAH1903610.1 PilZ domain-containing protein [Candidatus Nitrotoga sp. HW29]
MPLTHKQAPEKISEKITTLEEARLQVGDLVNLQILADGADERYSAKLIGLFHGHSVLVTTPMIDGKYELMRVGHTYILRVFSGRSAFAFTTHILKSLNTPYPYLHLAYPREVRSLVVRKGDRAKVKLICAITGCDEAQLQEAGTIVNLSIDGAMVGVKKVFGHKGQKLSIKFKVIANNVEAFLKLDAIIKSINTHQFKDTDLPYQLGLQFVDVSTEDSIPLLAFVYHKLMEQSL